MLLPMQIIEDDKRERERARAKELAERERETQELLKSGMGMTSKRAGTANRRGACDEGLLQCRATWTGREDRLARSTDVCRRWGCALLLSL